MDSGREDQGNEINQQLLTVSILVLMDSGREAIKGMK